VPAAKPQIAVPGEKGNTGRKRRTCVSDLRNSFSKQLTRKTVRKKTVIKCSYECG